LITLIVDTRPAPWAHDDIDRRKDQLLRDLSDRRRFKTASPCDRPCSRASDKPSLHDVRQRAPAAAGAK
jgi:hypothetical protein